MQQKIIDLAKEKQNLIAELTAKGDSLVERLDRGAVKIEELKAQGKNTNDLEDFWIGLLRQYEKVADRLAELAPDPEGTAA